MAETVNPTELAQAIVEGKSLVEIAKQAECTSLTVARVLYGHYAHATIPDGLTGQALRHYMTLRRDVVRLCQKAGVGPLRSREEDAEEMPPRLKHEKLVQLSRAALAGDLAAGRSIEDMARKRGVTEKTIRGYLHRHGLLDATPQIPRQTPTAIVCEGLEEQLSGMTAASEAMHEAPPEPVTPQSTSEAAGAIRPPSEGNHPPDPATDKPTPGSSSGEGAMEGDVTPIFRAQVSDVGIDISLSDDHLTPAQVRQYLSVAEANLELAGEGLELHLSIRGPRR